MRIPRSEQFDDESERFGLRFCCEDCGHFDPVAERCRHRWLRPESRTDAKVG